MTLDYQEDLELIRLIVNKITQRPILMKDIVALFNEEPELVEINKNVNYYEGYEKSKKEDIEFLDSKRIKQK